MKSTLTALALLLLCFLQTAGQNLCVCDLDDYCGGVTNCTATDTKYVSTELSAVPFQHQGKTECCQNCFTNQEQAPELNSVQLANRWQLIAAQTFSDYCNYSYATGIWHLNSVRAPPYHYDIGSGFGSAKTYLAKQSFLV